MITADNPTTMSPHYDIVSFRKESSTGYRSIVWKFTTNFAEDVALYLTTGMQFSVHDEAAFEEASTWVFNEYPDVFKNLAA